MTGIQRRKTIAVAPVGIFAANQKRKLFASDAEQQVLQILFRFHFLLARRDTDQKTAQDRLTYIDGISHGCQIGAFDTVSNRPTDERVVTANKFLDRVHITAAQLLHQLIEHQGINPQFADGGVLKSSPDVSQATEGHPIMTTSRHQLQRAKFCFLRARIFGHTGSGTAIERIVGVAK